MINDLNFFRWIETQKQRLLNFVCFLDHVMIVDVKIALENVSFKV